MQTYSGFEQNWKGCWREYLILHRKHMKWRYIKVFDQVHSRSSGSARLKSHGPLLLVYSFPDIPQPLTSASHTF